MSALEEIQEAIGTVGERVGPAVVGVGRRFAGASGVVFAEGQVLTNAHNVRGDEVTVTFGDGREAPGHVQGLDVDGDLAVISTDTAGTAAVPWAPPGGAAGLGTPVFALANPGGRGLRVTFGLVSATGRRFRGPRGRRITGTIEHSAPLVRGSSGGPLVDAQGALVGLNTIRLEGGLVLALAAPDVRERAEALARGESPARLTLGVMVAPPRVARRMRRAVGLPERAGILVRGTLDSGPAARAGIERGDLIVAAGGGPIERLDDLFRALDALKPNDTLQLTVVRGTEERDVVVLPAQGGAPAEK